jgi:hypothetical protein
VQGLIETTFVGAHAIKAGRAAEVYRLDSICHGATRFEVAVGRAENDPRVGQGSVGSRCVTPGHDRSHELIDASCTNHTIVPSRDKDKGARFYAKIFGLEYDGPGPHFAVVKLK